MPLKNRDPQKFSIDDTLYTLTYKIHIDSIQKCIMISRNDWNILLSAADVQCRPCYMSVNTSHPDPSTEWPCSISSEVQSCRDRAPAPPYLARLCPLVPWPYEAGRAPGAYAVERLCGQQQVDGRSEVILLIKLCIQQKKPIEIHAVNHTISLFGLKIII